ncbi:MAG: polyprenyl synthetase family protein [Deltaproteobacteria bacterium]|nr:polyprenyl synthetase family protein [Deltaproteobacteria bacterium]MBW2051544.1 polyprenyl synthetase family protein [Deltaproteobacteria bacterium]MBW2140109.1 polyprenyl synthetase family protein [Deltaproteobacteria bacterium]
MDLKAYLAQRREMIDRALEEALPEEHGLAQMLDRAMRYSLFAGGKRLRPILCLAGAETVGGSPEAAMPAAVALEMIHTYSLIHDDLPFMDDDDLRRGRATSHKVFGEALAILAGDGLLTEGLGQLARAGLKGLVPPDRALAALDVIARAAGKKGMIAGQVVDMESEGREVDETVVRFIHNHKSGALIAASVTSGAILGGGGESQIEAINYYGRSIGLAFQITDDILDIEGDPELMGKETGGDEDRCKATYPGVAGRDRSWEVAQEMVAEGRAALSVFGREADSLREIASYFLTRRK